MVGTCHETINENKYEKGWNEQITVGLINKFVWSLSPSIDDTHISQMTAFAFYSIAQCWPSANPKQATHKIRE